MFKGKEFLLQVEDSVIPDEFVTIAGMRQTGMTINNEQVDITNKDGNLWRTLLEGAGVQSMSISGSGVFDSSAVMAQVMSMAMANRIARFRIVSESGETITGSFQIASLERSGEYNKEEVYSITLESADEPEYVHPDD